MLEEVVKVTHILFSFAPTPFNSPHSPMIKILYGFALRSLRFVFTQFPLVLLLIDQIIVSH